MTDKSHSLAKSKLLILDNYDSFTYNLVHLIEKMSDIAFDVFRNDEISIEAIANYDKILLSPGPGLPKDAGIMPELIKKYAATKKIFGVCLGMQAIAEAFGGELKNLEEVCHGQSTLIHVVSSDTLFQSCPLNFNVGRYHSWVVKNNNLPDCLEILALDNHKNIMALKHKALDVCGVQFHPESILTENGDAIIKNWIYA